MVFGREEGGDNKKPKHDLKAFDTSRNRNCVAIGDIN
jgi:hypothetical protein